MGDHSYPFQYSQAMMCVYGVPVVGGGSGEIALAKMRTVAPGLLKASACLK